MKNSLIKSQHVIYNKKRSTTHVCETPMPRKGHFFKNVPMIFGHDLDLGTKEKVLPQINMEALSLAVQKLWPMLKYLTLTLADDLDIGTK